MKHFFNPADDTEKAKFRQTLVDSAHRAMDSREYGLDGAGGFLMLCLKERVWERGRVLEMGTVVEPTSFEKFCREPYPCGLGSSVEKLEVLVTHGFGPGDDRNEKLRSLWFEVTGRSAPALSPTAEVKLSDIRVPDGRRRSLNVDRVRSIADSIKELGLINPITITDDMSLVAGHHRLEACRLLGMERVTARVARLDDVHRELAEIDENLIRVELTAMEMNEHLARRKELYEALHPSTKRGAKGAVATNKKRWNSLTPESGVSDEPSFVDDTASKTGKSKSTIKEAIQVATSLDDETKAAVRGTPIEDKQTDLLELARTPEPETRKKLVEAVVSGEAKNVKEAKRKLEDAEPPSDKPKRQRFEGDVKLLPDPVASAARIRERFGDEWATQLGEALLAGT